MQQLIAHLVGDYIFQSHWMAMNKGRSSLVCFIHCVMYTLPFFLLTDHWLSLSVIFSTHFVIDRFRLARYINWVKNWQSPLGFRPWRQCKNTGYYDVELEKEVSASEAKESGPVWLRTWLLIITDNTLHLICNFFALRLGTGFPT